MKNYQILTLLLLLLSILGYGQSYNLTVTNEPFIPLVNGTHLIEDSWSDPEFSAALGFEFQYFNEKIDTLYSFYFFAGGYFSTNTNLNSMDLLLPFSTDLIDRGYEIDSILSPILYKTEGQVGKRVFTLEFKNAGFNSGEINNDIYTDYINLQLKIYEENNIPISI